MAGRAMIMASLGVVMAAGGRVAPSKITYRLETHVEQVMTLPGQGEQRNDLAQFAVFTVALDDSAGGKAMHVVIDSVAVESGMAPPAAELAKLKGAWLHGFVDARNRTSILAASDDSSEVLSQIRATLATFLPRVKLGLKAGDTWADTANVESRSPAQATKSRVITSYTAGGEETVAGVSARHIDASFTATTTGTLQNPQTGAVGLEATETGTSVWYVSSDGRFLGGQTTSHGQATLRLDQLPDPIPVKTTRTSTTTVLRQG